MATENLADGDRQKDSVPGQNQNTGVIATPGQTTTASNAGTATGIAGNPGGAGTGKNAAENPGKRLYNPLSQLASYTYNLTLYMVTPDAYEAFKLSGRTKIDALAKAQPVNSGSSGGAFVIAQSGGINNKTQTRAPGFELDYYIDNLKVNTRTNARSTGTSAFTGEISFTITEPYGFSFLSNLRRAKEALAEYSNQTTYKENTSAFRQFFILGIRFYGYDINGNVITGKDVLYDKPIDPGGGTEALFEQFHEVEITGIKFTLNGKTAVYNISARSIDTTSLLGTKRGRIVKGGKYRGSTVHEMLTGSDGLFTQLNKEQNDKISKNPPDQKFANKYEVVYLDDAYERIGQASMVLASDLNKWRWPGSGAAKTIDVNDATSVNALPNNTARELVFNNDTSIMQAITQIIQKSTYMENALKTVYNNVTQPNTDTKTQEQVKKSSPQPLAWFTVSADVTKAEWDPIISDWAYTTKFVIQVYEIPTVVTPYSNTGTKYYGPHKRYQYFFTGQNSEVLDFSIAINTAFQNTVLTSPAISSPGDPGGSNEKQPMQKGSASGQIPVQTGIMQNADTTGSLNTSAEAQNSVATQLLDPVSYAEAKLKIIGDPDFLIRPNTSSLNELYNKFYGSDGFTISAHAGTVFVEVEMKEAQDYKNSQGIQLINEDILFIEYPPSVKKIAKGIIYEVIDVTSTFGQGKFEQLLTLRSATAFTDNSTDVAQATAAGRESSTPGNVNSGAAPGNSKASGASTGQRTDPPPPTPQAPSPSNSNQNTNTVGNPTPQTVSTSAGQVADDDGLSEVQVTSRRVAGEGREQIATSPLQLVEPGNIDVSPPAINIPGGRG